MPEVRKVGAHIHKYWVSKNYTAAVDEDQIGLAPASGKTLVLQDIILATNDPTGITVNLRQVSGGDPMLRFYMEYDVNPPVIIHDLGLKFGAIDREVLVTIPAIVNNCFIVLTADEV